MKAQIFLTIMVTLLAACAINTPQEITASVPIPETQAEPQPTQDSQPPKEEAQGEMVIVYELIGGIRGVSETWTIFSNGDIMAPGNNEKAVDQAEVEALIEQIVELGFYEMDEGYGMFSPCRDCFNVTITVKDEGRVKTVSMVEGAGDVPDELKQIAQQIWILAEENR